MGEITSALSGDEIITHFREVLAPYVTETQLSSVANSMSPNVAGCSVQSRNRGKLHTCTIDFIKAYTRDLQNGLRNLTKEKVWLLMYV